MVLMGMEMPLAAIKSQIAAGIDIIVHLGRLRDRTRKVLEIVEIVGYTNSEIVTNTLFQFCENLNGTQIQNKVNGALKWSGKLINTTKLENAGFKKEARLYGESD